MKKILGWVLSFTKLGKVVTPVQKALSGWKAYLAGIGLIVPALITILNNFSDQGMQYLLYVTNTPEWTMILNGIGVMGIRAAITKAANPAKDPNVSR